MFFKAAHITGKEIWESDHKESPCKAVAAAAEGDTEPEKN